MVDETTRKSSAGGSNIFTSNNNKTFSKQLGAPSTPDLANAEGGGIQLETSTSKDSVDESSQMARFSGREGAAGFNSGSESRVRGQTEDSTQNDVMKKANSSLTGGSVN